jgi:hypothetical protein
VVEAAAARGVGVSEQDQTAWSERLIARAIALQTFKRRYLMAVPNCSWTGHECDLLVVTENLRIIDVEVKISRSDLKADAKKEKWWHREFKGYSEPVDTVCDGHWLSRTRSPIYDTTAREWPPKVWKHYYALPKEIWKPELVEFLPSKSSGILILDRDGYPRPSGEQMRIYCERRATPNKEAKPISAAAAVDIARLASLRMWESYQDIENMLRDKREAA